MLFSLCWNVLKSVNSNYILDKITLKHKVVIMNYSSLAVAQMNILIFHFKMILLNIPFNTTFNIGWNNESHNEMFSKKKTKQNNKTKQKADNPYWPQVFFKNKYFWKVCQKSWWPTRLVWLRASFWNRQHTEWCRWHFAPIRSTG